MADLEADNCGLKGARAKRLLGYIHQKKTGALIEASLTASAMASGLGRSAIDRIRTYGRLLGVSFQIVDDILDVEGDELTMGKTKSDERNMKLTFPSVYGLEYAKKTAFNMIEEAKLELDGFGKKALLLKDIADFVFYRNH